MSRRDKDVPGNTMESQRLFDEQLRNIGRSVLMLESGLKILEDSGIVVKALRFVHNGGSRGDILCVVTAHTETGGIVSFVSGVDLSATIRTMSNQIRNGSIKWKEDQYANEQE